MSNLANYETLNINLSGKRCIVTGANSGVGKESARKLLQAGASLTMVCRNPDKAEAAKQELQTIVPNASIDILLADLSSIEETHRVAQEILEKYPKIDLLVNNAGAHIMGDKKSKEGLEMNFAVNYLGPFVLINLLLPRIKETPGARIVVVTSEGHRLGALMPFADYQSKRSPNAFSYMRAKFYAMLLVQTIDKHLKGSAKIHAVCPGLVASNFFDVEPMKSVLSLLAKVGIFTINTPEKGSRSSMCAAVDADYGKVSGKYVASYPLLRLVPASGRIYDKRKQEALWNESVKLTGLSIPDYQSFIAEN